MVQYKAIIRTLAGIKLHEITEFRSLAYTKKRNTVGDCSMVLDADNPKLADFEEDCIIEIWRRNKAVGLSWYCDYYGIYKAFEFKRNKIKTFTTHFVHVLDFLAARIVAWSEDTYERSLFEGLHVETILNRLVQYNVTADATTANGRLRSGVNDRVTVETNNGTGDVVPVWKCHEQNLLKTMAELANKYKCAFDFQYFDDAWQWYFIPAYAYAGSSPFNKTDAVKFSIELGNVREVSYGFDRRKEATVAVIGGKNTGSEKSYTQETTYRHGPRFREIYVSASNSDSSDERSMEGSNELENAIPRPEVEFDIIQTPGTYYGLHYNLNDYVTGLFNGDEHILTVSQVDVQFTPDNYEVVKIGLKSLEDL